MKKKIENPLHFHKPTSFLITPLQLEDFEGRRNDYYRKVECCYKKEERKIVLKSKMTVYKRDLIKTKNSKAIRDPYRPQERGRRQQKEMRHSPSKENSNCSDGNMFSKRSPISF